MRYRIMYIRLHNHMLHKMRHDLYQEPDISASSVDLTTSLVNPISPPKGTRRVLLKERNRIITNGVIRSYGIPNIKSGVRCTVSVKKNAVYIGIVNIEWSHYTVPKAILGKVQSGCKEKSSLDRNME